MAQLNKYLKTAKAQIPSITAEVFAYKESNETNPIQQELKQRRIKATKDQSSQNIGTTEILNQNSAQKTSEPVPIQYQQNPTINQQPQNSVQIPQQPQQQPAYSNADKIVHNQVSRQEQYYLSQPQQKYPQQQPTAYGQYPQQAAPAYAQYPQQQPTAYGQYPQQAAPAYGQYPQQAAPAYGQYPQQQAYNPYGTYMQTGKSKVYHSVAQTF
jgi:hypothetical protein